MPRTLWIGGHEVEVGYVEAVATAPEAQGRGHGTAVMRAIADEIASRHRLGVLSTGEWHFYERLEWRRWLVNQCVLPTRALHRVAIESDE